MVLFIKSSLIVALLLLGCRVIPQKKDKPVQIESVKIYKYFKEGGYTTAGAYTHFDDLEKEGTELITIDSEDKSKLQRILNRTEKKKHYQTKFGINNNFCLIKFADAPSYHRVIISSVGVVYNAFGKVKEERAIITDLTDMINYKVTDPNDLQWLSEFRERMAVEISEK